LNNLVFNILVTGESGSGKTLFVKNFLKKISKNIKKSNTQQKSKFNNPSRDEFNVYDSNDKLIAESDIYVGIATKEFIEYKVNCLSMTKNNIFKIIDSPGYSGTRDSQTIANKVIEYIHDNVKSYLFRIESIIIIRSYQTNRKKCKIVEYI
jgi:septin family protein